MCPHMHTYKPRQTSLHIQTLKMKAMPQPKSTQCNNLRISMIKHHESQKSVIIIFLAIPLTSPSNKHCVKYNS
jgi:hypothetical protein